MERETHAIVVGGSIAGLLAARVLADHATRVTVVERDRLPDDPVPRSGVPQARHVHILLQRGQHLLEAMFPSLDAELAAAGAPTMNLTGDFPVLSLGGWNVRYPSSFVARTCSRVRLEWTIRQRLAALGNLQFRDGLRVTGLVATPDRSRVTGVRVQAREAGAEAEELAADLMMDASGRTSHTPEWLRTLGYDAPQETIINSFLGYSTRWYEAPTDVKRNWKGMLIGSLAPLVKRSGIIFPAENGLWAVTLMGMARDYPPTDEAGYLEFARSLRSPLLYDSIKDARPVTSIYGYQRTENRRLYYERLARWPDGFVVMGDAACAFNPVYGQGMTTAAVGAQVLDRCLRDQGGRSVSELAGRRFQKTLARATATPWLMATGEDFRWETTEGGRPGFTTRLMHRYMDNVLRQNVRSLHAYTTFLAVAQLLKPPAALFSPAMIGELLAQAAMERIGVAKGSRDVAMTRPVRPVAPDHDGVTALDGMADIA
jgi:2-polyprenyl-6-methoxyphenol hydroxylase-like FAD-dependent oxidoreductase